MPFFLFQLQLLKQLDNSIKYVLNLFRRAIGPNTVIMDMTHWHHNHIEGKTPFLKWDFPKKQTNLEFKKGDTLFPSCSASPKLFSDILDVKCDIYVWKYILL